MSTSRPTPSASSTAWAARRPDRWIPSTSSRPSTNAASASTRSALWHNDFSASQAVRVAGVREHRAVVLDAHPVGLDGVVDQHRRHGERADPDRLTVRPGCDVELGRHPRLGRQVVGAGQPVRGAGRAPHRDPRARRTARPASA